MRDSRGTDGTAGGTADSTADGTTGGSEARLLLDALERRRVRTLFQPLVDLGTGGVIGHEALSRGPAGTGLEQPGRLFAAARAVGRIAELDWTCRCGAFRDALHSDRRPSWRLFVNAEPEALHSTCPRHLLRDWLAAHRALRVVVELTERHLLSRPADLLRTVATLRELGWEVALDDVGANDDGVALLPVVEPDVVKLDAELLGPSLTAGQRATLRAVEAWTSRTGTPVVAEGIETERQLQRAVDLGATWGQGFRFGRPSPPVPGTAPPGQWLRPSRHSLAEEEPDATPFDVVPEQARTAQRGQVAALVEDVCAAADADPTSALLLVSAGRAGTTPQGLSAVLERLSGRCALVVLLAPAGPAPSGVRTTVLPAQDPLTAQTSAVLLGPGRALLVAARERADGDLDLLRSEEPDVVARAARLLLARTEACPSRGAP